MLAIRSAEYAPTVVPIKLDSRALRVEAKWRSYCGANVAGLFDRDQALGSGPEMPVCRTPRDQPHT